MALNLTKETRFGVDVTYHRISFIQWLKENNKVIINVKSYTSKDSAKNGNKHLLDKNYTVDLYEMPTAEDFRQGAYLYLKTLEEWKEAVDVLEEGQEA